MSVYKHWNEAEFYGNLSDWLASFGFDWFCCLFGIISFPSFFIPCRLIDHKNVFFSFNLYFTDFVFFMYKISEGKLFFLMLFVLLSSSSCSSLTFGSDSESDFIFDNINNFLIQPCSFLCHLCHLYDVFLTMRSG